MSLSPVLNILTYSQMLIPLILFKDLQGLLCNSDFYLMHILILQRFLQAHLRPVSFSERRKDCIFCNKDNGFENTNGLLHTASQQQSIQRSQSRKATAEELLPRWTAALTTERLENWCCGFWGPHTTLEKDLQCTRMIFTSPSSPR